MDAHDETRPSSRQPETYNPWSIVNLVFHHLATEGLHPVLGDAGDPGVPAADLLRALGVTPAAEGSRQAAEQTRQDLGEVVAQVMATKPNVTVTWLPSMMRVDAIGRTDVTYDEISEAAGEEPGWFNAAEFEESMSTHYGRMIHEDDRTILFANPEDAAEYLGFDLVARS